MIRGSCLCGGVTFEISEAAGPFEICHCNRCRKTSGSGHLATLTVATRHFCLLSGEALITAYAAPVLYAPPAYQAFFCKQCGSPLPEPHSQEAFMEIPAGLLDEDPAIRPDKHIFTEFTPPWDSISDELPQYTLRELVRERHNRELPADFVLKTHYERNEERS